MFLRVGIPYQIVGGTRFFDRAEIRDVMAYLSVIVNPADDISAKRVVNTPRRGVGKTTIAAIEHRAATENLTFMDALQQSIADDSLTSRARNGLAQFDTLIRTARTYSGSLRDVVEMIVAQTGMIESLEAQRTPEAQTRIENIREFFGVVSEFEEQHAELVDEEDPAPTVEAGITEAPAPVPAAGEPMDMAAMAMAALAAARPDAGDGEGEDGQAADGGAGPAQRLLMPLMEWLSLRSDLDTMADSDSQVTLMTVHSAKGLEFPVVFMAGMEEGIFPHMNAKFDEASLEEERRLAYVAITRAKEHLSVVLAQQRSLYGSTQNNPPSRFLREIPESCVNFSGIGSNGYSGTGHEKRGSRRGIYGSGTRYEQSAEAASGRIYGSGGKSENLLDGGGSKREKAERFSVGDKVDHKVFGRGVVVGVNGDELKVRFEKTGQTKTLLLGFAPIVKIG